MIVSGKELADYESENPKNIDFGEVCITATPKKLRKLAEFLNYCADMWEQGGTDDHAHYNDSHLDRPQIVLINPNTEWGVKALADAKAARKLRKKAHEASMKNARKTIKQASKANRK